jgi:hypothetical protein
MDLHATYPKYPNNQTTEATTDARVRQAIPIHNPANATDEPDCLSRNKSIRALVRNTDVKSWLTNHTVPSTAKGYCGEPKPYVKVSIMIPACDNPWTLRVCWRRANASVVLSVAKHIVSQTSDQLMPSNHTNGIIITAGMGPQ